MASGGAAFRAVRPLLGTMVEVELEGDLPRADMAELAGRAFARVRGVRDLMSWHDPDSELTRVNRHALRGDVQVSPDTARVLRAALELSRATDGRYDVTVAPALVRRGRLPGHGLTARHADWTAVELAGNRVRFLRDVAVDLGGIAKGYAVDAAFETVDALAPELRDIRVNAGGDLRRKTWRGGTVGLRHPRGLLGGGRMQVVAHPMLAEAVATSVPGHGTAASRWVDPATGRERRPGAASVFAPTCMAADALTKAVLAGAATPELMKSYSARAVVPGERTHPEATCEEMAA